MRNVKRTTRRGTILLMIVGLLAMLFIVVSAYIMLARFDRQTLGYARQGQRVEDIVDATFDVLLGRLDPVRRDTAGGPVVSVGGAEVPGYDATKSRWLSSQEPIWDATSQSLPANQRYLPRTYVVTPTNLAGTDVTNVPFTDLMWNGANLQVNARQPLTDAPGTGVPDAYFIGTRVLTELANAMFGRPVSANGVDLRDTSTPEYAGFMKVARYILAVRVVSHGGFVSLGVPPSAGWAQQFAQGMFNWVRHPTETDYLGSGGAADARLLERVWAARDAVESAWRIRDGLLPLPREGDPAGMPAPLGELMTRFKWTVNALSLYADKQLGRANFYQRFNLADPTEWDSYRQATYLEPAAFNGFWYGPSVGYDPRTRYLASHLLSSISQGDESARVSRQWPPPASDVLGLSPGQLKFYLGKITDPTQVGGVALGAFRVSGALKGTFNNTDKLGLSTEAQGFVVVRELANYFYEMLAPYDGWKDGAITPKEAVTRREQAFMLAVNLVAFAAPRMANGNIDAVYYDDSDGVTQKRYVGYAPQPFITQVVAYNDPDTSKPTPTTRIALAVELYNPNDDSALPIGVGPPHSLDLSRYAISINTEADPPGAPLDPTKFGKLDDPQLTNRGPLPGRTFCLVAVEGNGNSFFSDHQAETTGGLRGSFNNIGVSPYPTRGEPITVKLWRRAESLAAAGSNEGWYLVDRLEVKPDKPANPKWYVNAKRDTTYEPYLGRWGAVPTGLPARWRMTVAFEPGDSPYKADVVDGEPKNLVLQELGDSERDPNGVDLDATQIAWHQPCVPLYTMNANVVEPSGKPTTVTPVEGAARPASFPTVGFMLFTPRFSHVVDLANNQYTAMSSVLRKQWDEHKSTYAVTNGAYPADFGHMPIFDNEQTVKSDSIFADTKAGRVPWGTLVFDYFTTLNPSGEDNQPGTADDIDLYRVPGRIDINTAPWNVLAALPVIGPQVAGAAAGQLPIHTSTSGAETNAAAAFWSPKSGVLAGTVLPSVSLPTGLKRFSEVVEAPGSASRLVTKARDPSGWHRLGPYLAEAAAAYRDRVKYVATTNGVFPDAADDRNFVQYRPAMTYGLVRGQGTAPDKRGFLSLGELANVMGFDSSTGDQVKNGVAVGGTTTVLGGYGLAVGGDFMKAVSLMALLDTHFLTTRSNVFTIYVTVNDLENPQASVRSQLTVDRSNLLPRLVLDANGNPVYQQNATGSLEPVVIYPDGQPEIIGQREIAYFNTRYDE